MIHYFFYKYIKFSLCVDVHIDYISTPLENLFSAHKLNQLCMVMFFCFIRVFFIIKKVLLP